MTYRWSHVVRTALVALAILAIAGAVFTQSDGRYRIVLGATHYAAINPSCAVSMDPNITDAFLGKFIWYPLKRPHATSENPALRGDGGYATYKVNIPVDGWYYVWARGWWQDGCGNSWFLVVDGGDSQVIGQDATYGTWKWRKAAQPYNLGAGVHSFKLQDREDGARIDQVLITNDARFQPVRMMQETPDYNAK